MPDIRLEGLTRRFDRLIAVNDITARFAEGSVTCLLGPSGCGKTTLMRMIAGLEAPTAGRIFLGDRDVTRLPAHKRDVAMVFQYPVMYRTCSVIENIELPLRNDRSLSTGEWRRRVDEVLDVLGLSGLRDAQIGELDIGSRQKVAVGRAIARRCDVILFDEPTTNVEVNAKLQLIRAFKEFRQRLKQTIIYVTHDQTEAMTLADQIALMCDGVISQCAAPRRLYDNPESEFGGWFLGNPGMNFLRPRAESADGLLFDVFPHALSMPAGGSASLQAGIRPEYVQVGAGPGPGSVPAQVLRSSITIGGQYLLTLQAGQTRLKAKTDPRAGRQVGRDVFLECPLDHLVFFRDGTRLPDRPRFVD